jgi:8-oxo-dGTP pyrophosphatase MutT (NUDIX family)
MSEYMRELRAKVGTRLLEVPSVSIVSRDHGGRVLLARHSNGGRWVLPGGAIEPSETPADAAMREMWEETGIEVELMRIVGVYGGPEFVVRYENGDETSYLMVVFEARPARGEPHADGVEVLEVRYFGREEAERLDTAAWVPEVLHGVFSGTHGGFRRPTWKPSSAASRSLEPSRRTPSPE